MKFHLDAGREGEVCMPKLPVEGITSLGNLATIHLFPFQKYLLTAECVLALGVYKDKEDMILDFEELRI